VKLADFPRGDPPRRVGIRARMREGALRAVVYTMRPFAEDSND
jgi:hypothetical protein